MTFRFKADEILLMPIIVLAFLFISMNFFAWVIDDLYIYFRYAENFISGRGIVFNPGEYVEGFSSFLWFIYLSLSGLAGLSFEPAAKYASLSLAVLNALVVHRITVRTYPGRFALTAPLLTLFNLPYVIWSVSGFETMLFIFLLLASLYLLLYQQPYASVLFPVLLFLIALCRPEGILFSLALLALNRSYSRTEVRSMIPAIVFSTLLLMFLIFRLAYFGSLLPNTYFAKIGHDLIGGYELRSYKNGFLYFIFFLRSNPQFVPALIFMLYAVLRLRKNKLLFAVSALLTCQIIFIIFSGGDWMVQYRFAVPAIPLLSILSTGLIMNAGKITDNFRTALAVVLCIMSAASLKLADKSIIEREIILWNNLKVLAPGMNAFIQPGSLAASGACGIMPYFLKEVRVLDMVGLTNKTIAREGYRSGMWFERSLPEYVYSKEPDWLIMWKKKGADGEYRFGNAAPVYEEMSKHRGFNGYEPARDFDLFEDVKVELYKRK